jgi:hypothetical protein
MGCMTLVADLILQQSDTKQCTTKTESCSYPNCACEQPPKNQVCTLVSCSAHSC